MTIELDPQKITDAIVASGVSGEAATEGASLVEAFIKALPEYEDTAWETVGVELVWFMALEPKTLIVGACDRTMRDPRGQVWTAEFKSKKPPRIKKDGTPYQGDREEDWLADPNLHCQLRVYALAMREATYLQQCTPQEMAIDTVPIDGVRKFELSCSDPHILIRAVNKSVPPVVWPVDRTLGRFSFPPVYVDATRDALLNATEQIRAARRRGVPWALPSLHCTNKYNRTCDYYAQFCNQGNHPQNGVWTAANHTDPGWKAISASGVDLNDPEVVVLSASSYQNWLQCAEQYRIVTSGAAPGEESYALSVGTAMHAGVGQVYRELMKGGDAQ